MIFAIGMIFFLAAFVQGLTGFGSALIAIPLLCLVVDIKFAIPLSVLTSLIITSLLTLKLKSHLDIRKLLPLCLSTLPGIAVGATLLKHVQSETMALLLGILLICYSSYNLFFTPKPRAIHHGWGYLAGFCSGAIGSAFSAGGPPAIIYTTLTGWSKDYIKATLTGFFLFNSIMVATAHGISGLTTQSVLISFLYSSPFVFAGTLLGSFCYRFLAGKIYLKTVYLFLIVMGMMMIVLKS